MFGPGYGQYHPADPYAMGTAPAPVIPPQPAQMTHPPPMPPTQIPPPNVDLMANQAGGRVEVMSTPMMKVQYPPHQPPPNFSQPPPGYPNGIGDVNSNLMQRAPQPALTQIPGPPSSPQCSRSEQRDFTASNTSFSGIGTSFETPQRQNSKKAEFAGNNTSFTGIGISFDTPAAKDCDQSEYFCSVCNFDLGNDERYENHCRGLMHTQKVAEKEGRKAAQTSTGPKKSKVDEEPKPKVIQDLREKYPDQYCEVCDTTMTSSIVFKQHLQGVRHKKNLVNRANGAPILRGRGNRRLPREQAEAETNLRCQALLDATEEVLIGLQFVTEFTKNNPSVEERYVCDICDAKCDPRTLMPHLSGYKHRLNYIKHEHEEVLEPHTQALKTMKKAERTALMAELALQVAEAEDEKPYRMKAKVEIDPFYNPNQDGKKERQEAASALKRCQREEDSQPPAKRPPRSRVSPNWGGPDPEKQQQQRVLVAVARSPPEGKCASGEAATSRESAAGAPGPFPHHLADIMTNLSKCLVNNEEEASMVLQVSNTLTQALLQYRLKNLPTNAANDQSSAKDSATPEQS